jgi:hypothetical protein
MMVETIEGLRSRDDKGDDDLACSARVAGAALARTARLLATAGAYQARRSKRSADKERKAKDPKVKAERPRTAGQKPQSDAARATSTRSATLPASAETPPEPVAALRQPPDLPGDADLVVVASDGGHDTEPSGRAERSRDRKPKPAKKRKPTSGESNPEAQAFPAVERAGRPGPRERLGAGMIHLGRGLQATGKRIARGRRRRGLVQRPLVDRGKRLGDLGRHKIKRSGR